MQRLTVVALDYDDCAIRTYGKDGKIRTEDLDNITPEQRDAIFNEGVAPSGMSKWTDHLLKDNQQLIYFLVDRLKNCDHAILCIGSNRQNPYSDMTNSLRNKVYSGSCFIGLRILANAISQLIGKKVEFYPLTTADIFRNVAFGTSADQVINWIETDCQISNDKIRNELFAIYPTDRTKVSLHAMFMQHFAAEYPQSDIDYITVDDSFDHDPNALDKMNPAIINCLNDVYTHFPKLIPERVTFTTIPYQHGELLCCNMMTIKGEGVQISNYPLLMLEMMSVEMEGNDFREKLHTLTEDTLSSSCWDTFRNPTSLAVFMHMQEASKLDLIPHKPSPVYKASAANTSLWKIAPAHAMAATVQTTPAALASATEAAITTTTTHR